MFLHDISWFPKDQSIGLGGLGEKETQAFISEYGSCGVSLSPTLEFNNSL
jgi:hypothetical protein